MRLNPNAPESEWRLEDARRVRGKFFSKENTANDLLRFGFAPAEIERSDLEESIKDGEFGRSLDAAIITAHVAMGKYDFGYHLVRNFHECGLLKPDLLLSHCAVAETGVSLTSNPDTELQMGMRQPVAFKRRKFGCKRSIGVDIASNNPADMFQRIRHLLQVQMHKDNQECTGTPLKYHKRASTC